MTTNKRAASSLTNEDNETKRLKSEVESTPLAATTSKESASSFVDENSAKKKMCEYGEACYRQHNPKHTAEYDHPCKLFYFSQRKGDFTHRRKTFNILVIFL